MRTPSWFESHSKDLLFVALYGLAFPMILGVLLGLISYFLQGIMGLDISYLLYWLLAIVTGSLVRRQYEQPHWLYSLLAGVGMVFSMAILLSVPILWGYFSEGAGFLVLLDLRFYFQTMLAILNPFNWFMAFSFNLVLTLLTLGVGTYLGIKRTL
jgi:hypothetical protein